VLLPWFQWFESAGLGAMIRESQWWFAAIESVHLLGLALIGGSVLIVDLRLLGLGMSRQSVRELAHEAQPYLLASLFIMIATGLALFLSESVKCYYSFAFWFKMTPLALAMLFTFTVRRRVLRLDDTRIGPVWGKLVAIVSLTLWFGVGAGGRWIGFQ